MSRKKNFTTKTPVSGRSFRLTQKGNPQCREMSGSYFCGIPGIPTTAAAGKTGRHIRGGYLLDLLLTCQGKNKIMLNKAGSGLSFLFTIGRFPGIFIFF
jgi:hypothetical protein